MSSAAWLQVLRGVNPNLLDGRSGGALLERLSRVEALSLLSNAPTSLGFLDEMSVGASTGRVSALARVMVAGNYLGYLDVLLRRVSKGQSLSSSGRNHLDLLQDHELDRVLDHFDRRSTRIGARWHPFIDYNPDSPMPLNGLVQAFANSDGMRSNAKQGADLFNINKNRWNVRFTLLSDRARHPEVVMAGLEPETGAYVASAYVLSSVVAQNIDNDMLRAAEGSGFVKYGHSFLQSCITTVLASERERPGSLITSSLPLSAEAVLRYLSEGGNVLHKRLGTPIRPMTNGFMVDLDAMTKVLHFGLMIDKSGGRAVNVLGDAFEPHIQLIIDTLLPEFVVTPTRALRGRTLTINGAKITDIDAIAEVNETVVLVSCKTFENTADLQAGHYRAVRSVDTRIAKALDEWADKLHVIRTNPLGDNFDLRGKKIVGIVVTPQFLFTSHPQARQRVSTSPPLFGYMATAELERSLGAEPDLHRYFLNESSLLT